MDTTAGQRRRDRRAAAHSAELDQTLPIFRSLAVMAKLPGAIQGARIVGEQYCELAAAQTCPRGSQPLFDHLRELRNRIVKMALGLIAGMIVGFIFFNRPGR